MQPLINNIVGGKWVLFKKVLKRTLYLKQDTLLGKNYDFESEYNNI